MLSEFLGILIDLDNVKDFNPFFRRVRKKMVGTKCERDIFYINFDKMTSSSQYHHTTELKEVLDPNYFKCQAQFPPNSQIIGFKKI